jgi:dCTP deaminase
MILSDVDIQARLREGDLRIDPLDDPELQIQPASVDLRLGNDFIVFTPGHIPCIYIDRVDDAASYTQAVRIPDEDHFILHPGEFALGTTMELVRIPHDLVGRLEGRSSLGRLAVIVHATAGFIDPGFEGRITLELTNVGKVPVALKPGMRCSQIVFHELKTPSARPYGAARGSKYQGQTGPIASRISVDRPMAERRG